ncbi:MAG TPA: metalloregulator ArsR/SmtB family transcription factor [Methanobacterium sp.]|nr:metalloregulator ArsR/SmtB family transcription factor [Methanobacterium sp.]
MKKCVTKGKCRLYIEDVEKFRATLSEIDSEDALYNLTEVFKALSDPTRIQILYLLQKGDLCVCELMSILEKPQSTLSHHLSILRNANLVKPRKEGVWTYYALLKPKVVEFIDSFNEKKIQ